MAIHKPEWFKVDPAKFLSDRQVDAMSTEEIGACFRLLCRQWIDGTIPDDLESPSFNAMEVAQILCQKNGWSGRGMIWALQSAIEFQAKRMPDAELEQVGELLLNAYSKYRSEKGKFAVNPQKFFEQGLYCRDSERERGKTIAFNPAAHALAQMEAD